MLLDLRLWGPACPRQAVGRDGPIDTQTPHKGVVEPTPPPHTHTRSPGPCSSQVQSHLPGGNFSHLPIVKIMKIMIKKTIHRWLGLSKMMNLSPGDQHFCCRFEAIQLQRPGIFCNVRLFWNFSVS